ncbi:E3 ubiquitin-protein ligase RING2 [Sarcoptes scabiei]|uniref:RING-type E3 ubiquitin transferase n=1 Tax=Sarcoptes scabiei TaxID=52283 RepID=A0A132A8F8_SARSC|nr:E3 ubiquitin-protein ligase RING2 [Sarcoptes scabiei]KPM07266.1 E3 ubiquitin-protein ligase RING2-like protein [Sarcoptes scabiei]UXI18268.1 pseudouridine-5'-monophosphatase-like [Sarcoptes scabiei]
MSQLDSTVNFGGKTWELSPYELHRQPQEVITDNTEIAVSPRSLHSELMCPICLDMLKSTMTTKECLHRFCQECIITALRSGNKECPTCRKKLISKRSLRHDPNFDALISRIYPSRDEYDAQQEQVINNVSKHFAQNIEETLRIQTLNRSRSKKNINPDDEIVPNKRSKSEQNGFANETNSNCHQENTVHEIELIIKPLPQVERKDPSLNQTRFLKTTTTATIDHIAKYLKIRYNFESSEEERESDRNENESNHSDSKDFNKNEMFPFTLYIAAGPGQYNPLQGSVTLAQIDEDYWKLNKPLELFYAYKVNPTS